MLLEGGIDDELGEPDDPAVPSLSAIVISRNNASTIANTVASIVNQDVPEPFEVIVVTSGSDRTADIVREHFPAVTVVELPRPALPGDARNAGLAMARGRFITFPGSHIELLPGSLAARLRAHRRGYAMVTGIVTNGTPTPAGWASYFLDHSEGLPGHGRAEFDGPPGNCSYARLPLLEVGGFPEGVRTAEDTAANRALVKRGYVAYRDPGVQFIHRSRCTTVPRLIRHHFQRGRGSGRLLVAEYREQGHLLNEKVIRTHLIRAVPKRLQRIQHTVSLANADIIAEYRRYRPLVALGAIATWTGAWYEILRPTRGKLSILVGKPVMNLLLVAGENGGRDLALVQIDYVSGQATMRSLSPHLPASHNGEISTITDLLAEGDRGEASSRLARFRHILGEALNVAGLECIIVPEMRLPHQSAPVAGGIHRSLSLAGLADSISSVATTLGALRRRKLRSTLSPWSTVRVLSHLHTFAKRSPAI